MHHKELMNDKILTNFSHAENQSLAWEFQVHNLITIFFKMKILITLSNVRKIYKKGLLTVATMLFLQLFIENDIRSCMVNNTE